MTDVSVEQGEAKKRKEHLKAPESADSSSEGPTDTEMGLVHVCTIFSENCEPEDHCRSGRVTQDLTR